MHNKSINELFQELFEAIPDSIVYNTAWSSSRDYRHCWALDMLKLEPGAYLKSVDQYNRRVIFMGTDTGLMVLYPRYVNGNLTHYSFDALYNVRGSPGKISVEFMRMLLKKYKVEMDNYLVMA